MGFFRLLLFCGTAIAAALPGTAFADETTPLAGMPGSLFDEGRLLATGGVSNIEGAGGGGLANWALITGYGTRDAVGIDAHITYVGLPDYAVWSPGVAVGLWDRVELSYARQTFDTEKVGGALGLGRGFEFHQDVWGAKVRLAGDAIFDQDSWLPQISPGIQYKRNDRGTIIRAIGGKSDEGTDYYVAATKLFLAQSVLASVALRETRANQFGILGFGGDKQSGYSTQFEGSAAYLVSRRLAIGAEYRTKPNNLGIAREDDAWDIFAAYFLCKNLSLTAAYVDLGNIVIKDHQRGAYLSLQAAL